VGVVALVVLTAPLIGAEIADFIENFPAYIQRLHEIATNPGRPWLRRIVGDGFGVAQQSSGEVAGLAARWLTDFLHSLWSGGRALISVFSLLVVTPIVTFYLVYDWNRIVATVDDWIPAEHRDTARALAREIDETIGGFLRGQGAICLILAACYAVALKSIGLNHGLSIGLGAGLLGFIPYLGALIGLVVSVSMVLVQFGLAWTLIATVVGIFFFERSMEAVETAIRESSGINFAIECPLMWLNKAGVWNLAATLGGNRLVEIVRDDTHTCYEGSREIRHPWGYGCAKCDACLLRRKGWQEFMCR
jgi:predicted PurR-regulated permease PerM